MYNTDENSNKYIVVFRKVTPEDLLENEAIAEAYSASIEELYNQEKLDYLDRIRDEFYESSFNGQNNTVLDDYSSGEQQSGRCK